MSKNKNQVFLYAFTAVLGSIAGVLKIVSIESPLYRLTVYDIPIMIAGFTIGPLYGGIVGLIADIFQMLLKGYPPSLMTLSSIMWGVIPGLFYYIKRYLKSNTSKVIVAVILIILTSATAFGINTLQLYLWYGSGSFIQLPGRIITAIIKLPIEAFVCIPTYYVYQNMIRNSQYNAIEYDL
ncbi:folate family ECF transporter S component [Mycoplasmatota bacterium]|nr:folate family ECF transporter S component [Mycoplasmatota bacterium]